MPACTTLHPPFCPPGLPAEHPAQLIQVDDRPLLLADLRPAQVRAGFPSPAEDFQVQRIDLMKELVRHPQASYLLRIRGDSMRDVGIFDGDVVLVDKAITPRSGQVVVAVVDGEFTCKTLQLRAGRIQLKAANPAYPDILPTDGQSVEIWGVVVAAIKQFPC
jgi:DNA polymerase V